MPEVLTAAEIKERTAPWLGYLQSCCSFGSEKTGQLIVLVSDLRATALAAKDDYGRIVEKFDDCRAALARRYEATTGKTPHPPARFKGDYHEWLIRESDKAAGIK